MKKHLALAAALVLTGCATGYQSAGFSGGFSEMQMAQDVYRISYRGNAFTSSSQTEEMALLRTAELTLQRGYSHFAVMDAQGSTDRSYYHQPGTTSTSITPTGFGSYQATSNTYGGYTAPIDKPKTAMVVKMMGANQGGMSAQEVYSRLAAKYLTDEP